MFVFATANKCILVLVFSFCLCGMGARGRVEGGVVCCCRLLLVWCNLLTYVVVLIIVRSV